MVFYVQLYVMSGTDNNNGKMCGRGRGVESGTRKSLPGSRLFDYKQLQDYISETEPTEANKPLAENGYFTLRVDTAAKLANSLQ